jgi:hypothetical protein
MQSGKTTSVNFLHGYEMHRHDFIKKFFVNEKGELVANAVYTDEEGKSFESMGIVDLTNDSDQFAYYASNTFWPYVRAYNYAAPLKELCIDLFGLSKEQCYGTNEQKNTLTNYYWQDMPGYAQYCMVLAAGLQDIPEGFMSARQFMQYFGTDVCRKMYTNIWVDKCMQDIKKDNSALALIGDCRFENEIDVVHENNGRVIYLTLNSDVSGDHQSERAGDLRDKCDAVVDNANMTIEEQCNEILNQLFEWGVLPKSV